MKIGFLALSIGIIDVILFWGGYNGVLRVGILSFVKVLCGLFILILLFRSLKLLISEGRFYLLILRITLALILVFYLFSMRGNRSPFVLGAKARIFNSIDPIRVQTWAEEEMARANGDEDIFISTKELPTLVKIDSWPQLGAYIRNKAIDRHVDIVWGSGVFGTYGIKVGTPDFTLANSTLWKPGVYFYTAL
ncbi:MAG TPA: hypothetical protein VHC44_13535 [Verrucomicrobiae bacterium]|nr:hypothetical protein [Verrucomicrobiae bacterium]